MTQLILNGLAAGSLLGIGALGFWLVYTSTATIHFAHGAVFIIASYSALVILRFSGSPLFVAAIVGIVTGATAGWLVERCLYRRLRARGSPRLHTFVASLGVYVCVENLIALGFGSDPVSFFPGRSVTAFTILDGRATQAQITAFVLFSLIAGGVLLARRSRFGTWLRAVITDAELATIVGIPVERVRTVSVLAGSALAALAGVLAGWDTALTPRMAMGPLLFAVVAVIVGGRSDLGTLAVAPTLGLLLHLSVNWIPAIWHDAVVVTVLMVFLFIRPHGVGAQAEAAESV